MQPSEHGEPREPRLLRLLQHHRVRVVVTDKGDLVLVSLSTSGEAHVLDRTPIEDEFSPRE